MQDTKRELPLERNPTRMTVDFDLMRRVRVRVRVSFEQAYFCESCRIVCRHVQYRVAKNEVSFCVVNQMIFRELRNGGFPPNLITKRISVSRRGIRKDIFENFHLMGHLPPKFEIENRSTAHGVTSQNDSDFFM